MMRPSAFVSQILNKARFAAPSANTTATFKKGDEVIFAATAILNGSAYLRMLSTYGMRANADYEWTVKCLTTQGANQQTSLFPYQDLTAGVEDYQRLTYYNSAGYKSLNRVCVAGSLTSADNVAATESGKRGFAVKRVGNVFSGSASANYGASWTDNGDLTKASMPAGQIMTFHIYASTGNAFSATFFKTQPMTYKGA